MFLQEPHRCDGASGIVKFLFFSLTVSSYRLQDANQEVIVDDDVKQVKTIKVSFVWQRECREHDQELEEEWNAKKSKHFTELICERVQ